jgi:protein-S-isoprenylcysteine O-methyltransferase Ste14
VSHIGTTIRTLGWLACCIYGSIPSFWLIIHPRAENWRERKRQRRAVYNILVPLWIAMWMALFALTFTWRDRLLYRSRYSWAIALCLFVAGIFLYVKARHGFSPLQLSGHHELEPDRHQQQLVVTGIRQHVRHPIYLGHLLEMFGWSIGTGLLVCWALTAFAVITGAIMIRSEEEELIDRFGDSYRDYQKQVPAIIPR